jgi:hypothetical protein
MILKCKSSPVPVVVLVAVRSTAAVVLVVEL